MSETRNWKLTRLISFGTIVFVSRGFSNVNEVNIIFNIWFVWCSDVSINENKWNV
jgi:hypothetical protein